MLKLDVQETMGLRQHKLLQADENNARSERGKREYSMWKESREALIAEGATPSMRVATATELSALGATPKFPEMAQIEIEEVARVVGRPRGPHFGSLVHAILSRVSLQAEKPEVEAAADFFGRTLGASEDEITAATEAIMRGLASPTIRRAAAAREIRRETPLAVTLEDGTVIEGIADLAFRDEANGAGWVVADFKTDFDLVARLDEYRVQLGFYIRAIQAATALPASGVILWI